MNHEAGLVVAEAKHRQLRLGYSTRDGAQREPIVNTNQFGNLSEIRIPQLRSALLTSPASLVAAGQLAEVGTFYLIRGSWLTICDVSQEWTAITAKAWKRAGLVDRIDLRLWLIVRSASRKGQSHTSGELP